MSVSAQHSCARHAPLKARKAICNPPHLQPAPSRLQDPLEVSLAHYTSMGFTREEAGLALAVACAGGAPADDMQAVAVTARKLRTLSEMGFPRELVAGALVACEGDADRAADACIAAQGG